MSEYLLETVQLRKSGGKVVEESVTTASSNSNSQLVGANPAAKIQSIQGNWRKQKGPGPGTSPGKRVEISGSLSREKRPSQTRLLSKIQVSKGAASPTPIQQLVSSAKERLNEAGKHMKGKSGVVPSGKTSQRGKIITKPGGLSTPTFAGQSKSPNLMSTRKGMQFTPDARTVMDNTNPSQSANSFSFDYSREHDKHLAIGAVIKQDFESSRNQTKLESPCSELLTDSRLELVDEEAQFLKTVSANGNTHISETRNYRPQPYSPHGRFWDPTISLNHLPNPGIENSTVSVVSAATVQPATNSTQTRTSFTALQRKLMGAAAKEVSRRGSSASKGNARPNSMLASPQGQTVRSASKNAISKLSRFVDDVYSGKQPPTGTLTKQPGSKSAQSSGALLPPALGVNSPIQISSKHIPAPKNSGFGWGSQGSLAMQSPTPTTPVCQDVLYPDGSFYTGDVLISPSFLDLPLPCGHGTLQLASGEQYVGQFGENGTFHGKGTLTTASGQRLYEGNFQNGEFGPIGTLHNVPLSAGEPAVTLAPSESCFGFKLGKSSPDRMFTTEDFQEEANPQLSLFESEAHAHEVFRNLELTDWVVYNGEFLNGKRHGLGSLTLSNGDKFTGEFQFDWAEGPGVYQLSTSNGPTKVVGFWSRNMLTARFQEKLDLSLRSSQDPSHSNQQFTSLESPVAATRRVDHARLHFGANPLTRKVSEQIARSQKPVSPVGSSKK